MPESSFFDSNVLLYLSSQDNLKIAQARAVIATGGTISVQVLNEYASVSRRQMAHSWALIRENIKAFRKALTVEPVRVEDHDLARRLAERHGLAFYDAVIAASALNAGCERLWTEDMHDGLVLEGRLRIENPFRRT